MRGSEFIFDSVNLLNYDLNKISLNRGKLYIDYPKWIKKKKEKKTINLKNNDNKCSFIAKYNWEGIEFPSYKKDWKSFELNNKSIALNIYYAPHNT